MAEDPFTLFDAWLKAVEGHRHHGKHGKKGGVESPLVDAAFKAFDRYVQTVETEHAAMASSISSQLAGTEIATASGGSAGTYCQSGNGVATTKDIAPFLALNLMA